MIVDLSAPNGASVNDGVSVETLTLLYPSIDHLSSLAISKGQRTWLV